jgi:signal transduction histidine kinase
MSLRSKILILFVTLALAPLLAVGISDYVQSIRVVTKLVEANLALVAERTARAISTRYTWIAADLRVLAEEYAAGQLPDVEAEPRWADLRETFEKIEVRAASGELLATLKDERLGSDACGRQPIRILVPVPVARGREEIAVVGWVPADRLLEGGALIPPYGQSGYTLLVDRSTGRVLYDPRCRPGGPALARFETEDSTVVNVAALEEWVGQLHFREADTARTAWFVKLPEGPFSPAWTVVTTTAIDEFTEPEGRLRLASLFFVFFLALATAGGFAILITQIMRSLDEVSSAASRIGDGDFTPWLPPPGHDEVGRLTMAIGAMVARLKETMGQLERSRQMAVVGELASHLSHEIRNPLSSIRLNLQSVEREIRRGSVPADLPVVLQLCLREITRLNRVVNNVLRLGRGNTGPVRPCRLHALLDESLEVVQPQLAHRGVRIERSFDAEQDRVQADGEQLSAALLNLYLNAGDAMSEGGTLRVWTETVEDRDQEPAIRVHVSDDGSGVSPEIREQIFKPFFTTKPHGSGIGLPLAQQTVEALGGRLYLEKRSELEPGTEFVIEIPLMREDDESARGGRYWEKPTLTAVTPKLAPAGAGSPDADTPPFGAAGPPPVASPDEDE